jgi:hypothetical protein
MITPKRRLPTDPRERSIELVRRSASSPQVPPTGLPPDLDEMVRKGERERAVLYARVDDVLDRCDRLAESISSSGIVVDLIDGGDDNSLAHSIEGLHDAQAELAIHH